MAINLTRAGTAIEVIDMVLDSAQLLQILPQLYNRFIKSKKGKVDEEKVKQLVAEGKTQEIMDTMVSSWQAPFSQADEMRLLVEVCFLILNNQMTINQGVALFGFLEKLENDSETTGKFRAAYITEEREEKRMAVLQVLSKLDTDEHRRLFLSAPGILNSSIFQKIQANVTAPLAIAVSLIATRRRYLERKKHARELAINYREGPESRIEEWWDTLKIILTFRIFR